MADIYVDASGGGSSTAPYDTWAKATASIQTAIDAWNVGDTIYCKNGAQSAYDAGITIDIDTAGGAEASTWDNPIKIVGCDYNETQEPPGAGHFTESGEDGRFRITGAGNAVNLITVASSQDYVWLVNIQLEYADATRHGLFAAATVSWMMFVNCKALDCEKGFHVDNVNQTTFVQCVLSTNSDGLYRPGSGWNIACRFDSNTGDGVECNASNSCYGCVFEGNGDGLSTSGFTNVFNCVFDGNTGDAINGAISLGYCIGTRITDTTGEDINTVGGSEWFVAYSYFEGSKDLDETIWEIPTKELQDTAHWVGDGDAADTNDGYVVGEYNLDPDEATYFSEELIIPAS